MNLRFPTAGLFLFLVTFPLSATPTYHVEVKCEPKRLEVKREVTESTEIAEESWGYRVTILSHTFKAIPDLRVEYLIFSKHRRFGAKSDEPRPERTSGNKALGSLQSNGKASFETDPVTIQKARLRGDWYYTNGAKGKAKDELGGIWVRVYSGDELIQEYAQPTGLKTQEKWEE